MSKTKSVHIWMEPVEFERYEGIAKERGISLSELVRSTLEEKFPARKRNPKLAVERISGMNVPLGLWNELEGAIVAKANAVLS